MTIVGLAMQVVLLGGRRQPDDQNQSISSSNSRQILEVFLQQTNAEPATMFFFISQGL